MKHAVIQTIFLLLISQTSFGQVTDDFTDGDFFQDPPWQGDTGSWIIENAMLRSNGPAITPNQMYLSTPSTISTNCIWEFFVNPKLATSSGNYMDFVAISDKAELKGDFNGYLIRIGGTSDEVSLFRKDGNQFTKIIDGTDKLIASSSDNPTKVKLLDTAGTFSLYADPTGSGHFYVLQGTAADTNHLFSSYAGVLVNYSAANKDKYFFDDINIQAYVPDTTGPKLRSVKIIDSSSLEVLFDEVPDSISALQPYNYTINGGLGYPNSISLGTNPSVVLQLKKAMVSGTNYLLQLSGITDILGNISPSQSLTFNYFVPGPGDVQINEIFADPSPVVGLPEYEFVELYNRSAFPINLENWSFGDEGSEMIFPNYEIMPDSFAILCAPAAKSHYESYGHVIELPVSASLLNNSGDKIFLKDAHGKSIHEIEYSDSWYLDSGKKDGGYSLEMINPHCKCRKKSNNWKASENQNGGTPGKRNSVYNLQPDLVRPKIISAQALSPDKLLVIYDEEMDSNSIRHAGYEIPEISGNITGIELMGSLFDSVIYQFKPSIHPDPTKRYTFKILGLNDCSGNPLEKDVVSFYYSPPRKPAKGDLLITEIMADPEPSVGLPQHEYLELYNRSEEFLSLNGMRLFYNTTEYELPDLLIKPHSYLILCSSSALASLRGYGEAVAAVSFPSLANTGAALSLVNEGDTVIFRVEYSSSWFQDGFSENGGHSLELTDLSNSCGTPKAWTGSIDPKGGTPGKANSLQKSTNDTEKPKLLRIYPISDKSVLVYFDKMMSLEAMKPGNYSIKNKLLSIDSVNFYDYSNKIIQAYLSIEMKASVIYELEINNTGDCSGNFPEEKYRKAKFGLPAAERQPLVINEILFNPKSGGSDYVEIFHAGSKIQDLKNMKIANTDEAGQIKDMAEIAPLGLLIFPGDYFVFSEDPDGVKVFYQTKIPLSLQKTGTLPSFPDDEGTVILLDSLGVEYDRFSYHKNFHFALIDNEDGVSLERIDPNKPTQNSANWTSASSPSGYGTPTYKNSQYKTITAGQDAVSLDPETFSPDGDGFNDILTISYRLPSSQMMANVKILDKSGRLIQQLAANEYLASEGFLSWDGTNENGEKAPIGIYVVWFEVFDLEGNTKTYKKACVVAGRL